MGYRSEVVLAVSKKMVPHFLTVLAQCEDVRGMIQDCDTFNENYLDEGGMLMHWSHVKWYDSYPEVAAIEKFIDDCESGDVVGWTNDDSEEEGETWNHYRFVRIGEERDDNDTRGSFAWENIDLMRSVSF